MFLRFHEHATFCFEAILFLFLFFCFREEKLFLIFKNILFPRQRFVRLPLVFWDNNFLKQCIRNRRITFPKYWVLKRFWFFGLRIAWENYHNRFAPTAKGERKPKNQIALTLFHEDYLKFRILQKITFIRNQEFKEKGHIFAWKLMDKFNYKVYLQLAERQSLLLQHSHMSSIFVWEFR